MRLVVVSDLHVGPGNGRDIFAGVEAFPAFVRSLRKDDHLVLNGDSFDFLMDDAPKTVDAESARRIAQSVLSSPAGRVVCTALRGHLSAGKVTVRIGNHDLELGLSAVRVALEAALPGVCIDVEPIAVEDVGGVRVAITHGEADDDWNRFDHGRTHEAPPPWPPGSELVKSVVNPLKDQGLAFIDLLKPDFAGAVLAALAVRPDVRFEVPGMTRAITRLLWRKLGGDALVTVEQLDSPTTNALYPDDAYALLQFLDEPDHLISMTPRVRWERVLRAALTAAAQVQRMAAGEAGTTLRSLAPLGSEWSYANALMARCGATVVMQGHTHTARFGVHHGRAFVNTGSWTQSLLVPPADAPLEEWTALLTDLKNDPTARKLRRTAFTAGMVEPVRGGAEVRLVVWNEGLKVLGSSVVRATPDALVTGDVGLQDDRAVSARRAAALEAEVVRAEEVTNRWGRLIAREYLQMLAETVRTHLERATTLPADKALSEIVRAEAVWDVYRRANDQRRNASWGRRLQHADAIARDGYHAALEAAREIGWSATGQEQLPTPLVMVSPGHSPVTQPRTRDVFTGILTNTAAKLPFPLIAVPADHLACPWLLATLLHEVGHDIDYDLGLRTAVKNEVTYRVGPRSDDWQDWVPEIIADLFGAALGGPAFERALVSVVHPIAGWHTRKRRYPPLSVRVAVCRYVLANEAPSERIRGDYSKDLPVVMRVILAATVPGTKATLGDLLAKIPAPNGWRHLPDVLTDKEIGPDEMAVAAEQFDHAAHALPPQSWQVPAGWHQFYAHVEPTRLEDPASSYKTPPLELLREFDDITFVGVTHRQLFPRIAQARSDRGRGWTRFEVFFLHPEHLDCVATKERPVELLRAEQAEAIGRFQELDGDVNVALYWFFEPTCFASVWRRAGLTHLHLSAALWRQQVRFAPATDYRSSDPNHGVISDVELALEQLRDPTLRIQLRPKVTRLWVGLSVSSPDPSVDLIDVMLALATAVVEMDLAIVIGGAPDDPMVTGLIEWLRNRGLAVENHLRHLVANTVPHDSKPWRLSMGQGDDLADDLTECRQRMAEDIAVLVAVGGLTADYRGVMPGIVEEVTLAQNESVPVVVATGWGGAAATLGEGAHTVVTDPHASEVTLALRQVLDSL